MTDEEIINAVRNKVQKQKDVAKEIGIDSIYFNKILSKSSAVKAGDAVLRRMERWLNKP
jgi:hypothetical protein